MFTKFGILPFAFVTEAMLVPVESSLNSFFVSLMYVLASSLPSLVVTYALYITDFVMHFPFSGHWLAFLQLHVFSWCSCISFLLLLSRFFFYFSFFLLCPSIILPTFGKQL